MHSKDGFHCCYNVQTAVDKGSHLIAEFQVTNHNTDQGVLEEVAQGVKKNLEIKTIEIVADKGYESREDILNCVMIEDVGKIKERMYLSEHSFGTVK